MDYRPPFGTRELAGETGSSAATVSRVCRLLEPDEILTREGPRGRIAAVDWEALPRRWAAGCDFSASNGRTKRLTHRLGMAAVVLPVACGTVTRRLFP